MAVDQPLGNVGLYAREQRPAGAYMPDNLYAAGPPIRQGLRRPTTAGGARMVQGMPRNQGANGLGMNQMMGGVAMQQIIDNVAQRMVNGPGRQQQVRQGTQNVAQAYPQVAADDDELLRMTQAPGNIDNTSWQQPPRAAARQRPTSATCGLNGTIKSLNQAHTALLREADMIHSIFSQGLSLRDFVAGGGFQDHTAEAVDALIFLRSHLGQITSTLCGQSDAHKQPPRATLERSGLPYGLSSITGRQELSSSETDFNLMEPLTAAVRRVRRFTENQWRISVSFQVDAENLIDLMHMFEAEVLRLGGQGSGLSSAQQPVLVTKRTEGDESTRTLRDEFNKALEKYQRMQDRAAEAQVELATKQQELMAAQQEAADLRSKANELEAKKEQYKMKAKEAIKQLEDAQSDALKQSVNQQAGATQLAQLKQAHEQLVSGLNEELAASRKQLKKALADLDLARTELQGLQLQNATTTAQQASKVQVAQQQYQRELASVIEELAQSKTQLAAALADLAKLRAEAAQTSKQLDASKTAVTVPVSASAQLQPEKSQAAPPDGTLPWEVTLHTGTTKSEGVFAGQVSVTLTSPNAAKSSGKIQLPMKQYRYEANKAYKFTIYVPQDKLSPSDGLLKLELHMSEKAASDLALSVSNIEVSGPEDASGQTVRVQREFKGDFLAKTKQTHTMFAALKSNTEALTSYEVHIHTNIWSTDGRLFIAFAGAEGATDETELTSSLLKTAGSFLCTDTKNIFVVDAPDVGHVSSVVLRVKPHPGRAISYYCAKTLEVVHAGTGELSYFGVPGAVDHNYSRKVCTEVAK